MLKYSIFDNLHFHMFVTRTDAVQTDLVRGHRVFLEGYQPGVLMVLFVKCP